MLLSAGALKAARATLYWKDTSPTNRLSAEMTATLRRENALLRQSNAVLRAENGAYQELVSEAQARISALLENLPAPAEPPTPTAAAAAIPATITTTDDQVAP